MSFIVYGENYSCATKIKSMREEINLFRGLLSRIEKTVRAWNEDLERAKKNPSHTIVSGDCSQDVACLDGLYDDDWSLEDVVEMYSSILRGLIVVSIYGFFEKKFVELSNLLVKEGKSSITFEDYKKNKKKLNWMEKLQHYFFEEIGADFLDANNLWIDLNNFLEIRNIFAHHHGVINSKERFDIIKKYPNYFKYPDCFNKNSDDQVFVSEDFLGYLLDQFDAVLIKIIESFKK